MDSRSACIQGVLKVKAKVKGHVIRVGLLSWILGMSYSVIDGLVCLFWRGGGGEWRGEVHRLCQMQILNNNASCPQIPRSSLLDPTGSSVSQTPYVHLYLRTLASGVARNLFWEV